MELDEERAKQAQDFINQSAYKEQIEIILGDAAENIEKLDKNYKFDMVLSMQLKDNILIICRKYYHY